MDKREEIKKINEKIKNIDEEIHAIYRPDGWDEEPDDVEQQYQDYLEENHKDIEASRLSDKKRKLLEETRKLRAEVEREEFGRECEIKSKNYKEGRIASDKESSIDTLSRDLYAKVLARHIAKKETETPLNIGIFGEWGEGKSSFIRLIEKEITSLNNKKWKHLDKINIVPYDASQYDERFKIWASILKELFEKFESEKGWRAKFSFGWVRLLKSLKKNVVKYVVNTFIALLTVGWFYVLGLNVKSLNDIKNNFLSVAGVIPFILFVTNILIPFIKQQLKFIQPLSSRVVSNLEFPNFKQDLGLRENVRENLENLLDAWINNKNEKIVIMVDELDRCTDKAVYEFFNALQLFMSVKGVVVILSVNYKTVCYSLANSHKYYFEKEIDNEQKIKFGIEYVKKYINIPIYLSTTYSYIDYISNILNQINGEKIQDSSYDISKNTDKLDSNTNVQGVKAFDENEEEIIKKVLNRVNAQQHITPREVKNIINMMLISKDICTTINRQKITGENAINYTKYIKWFLFQYFYNKIAQGIVARFGDENHIYIKEFVEEKLTKEDMKNVKGDDEFVDRFLALISDIRVEEVKSFICISNCFII